MADGQHQEPSKGFRLIFFFVFKIPIDGNFKGVIAEVFVFEQTCFHRQLSIFCERISIVSVDEACKEISKEKEMYKMAKTVKVKTKILLYFIVNELIRHDDDNDNDGEATV